MAEPAAPQGNGREQFVGTIAGHSISLAARDLVSILLLLGIFVLGYLVWQQFSFALRLLHAQHENLVVMLGEQNALLRKQTEEMLNLFISLDYNMGRPTEQRQPLRLSPSTPNKGDRSTTAP